MQIALIRRVTLNIGNEDEKNNGDSPKLKDSWHLRLDALLSSSLILLAKYCTRKNFREPKILRIAVFKGGHKYS